MIRDDDFLFPFVFVGISRFIGFCFVVFGSLLASIYSPSSKTRKRKKNSWAFVTAFKPVLRGVAYITGNWECFMQMVSDSWTREGGRREEGLRFRYTPTQTRLCMYSASP